MSQLAVVAADTVAYSSLLLVGIGCYHSLRAWLVEGRNHRGWSDVHEGPLTLFFDKAAPESGFVAATSLLMAVAGFGFLSWASEEAMAARVFRWTLAVFSGAIMSAWVPIAGTHMCLCSHGSDDIWWDELLCLISGLIVLALGWHAMRAKRRSASRVE